MVYNIDAGDFFHSAFLYIHSILDWNLEAAGVFASVAAALSCTKAGARAGLPDMETVIAFLHDFKIELPDVNY